MIQQTWYFLYPEKKTIISSLAVSMHSNMTSVDSYHMSLLLMNIGIFNISNSKKKFDRLVTMMHIEFFCLLRARFSWLILLYKLKKKSTIDCIHCISLDLSTHSFYYHAHSILSCKFRGKQNYIRMHELHIIFYLEKFHWTRFYTKFNSPTACDCLIIYALYTYILS